MKDEHHLPHDHSALKEPTTMKNMTLQEKARVQSELIEKRDALFEMIRPFNEPYAHFEGAAFYYTPVDEDGDEYSVQKVDMTKIAEKNGIDMGLVLKKAIEAEIRPRISLIQEQIDDLEK